MSIGTLWLIVYCIILSILTQQHPCLLISTGVSSKCPGKKTNIPLFLLYLMKIKLEEQQQ